MAESKSSLKGRISLVGIEDGEERPRLAVHALGEDGKAVASAQIDDDGSFELPAEALKVAVRVVIGPEDAKLGSEAHFVGYKSSEFAELVSVGSVNVARKSWLGWFSLYRCVSGSVERCFPWPWIIEDLIAIKAAAVPLQSLQVEPQSEFQLGPVGTIDPIIRLPKFGCRPVCQGRVEVFRRTCCCTPVFDPVDPPIEWPPIPIPVPDPIPEPWPIPGPGPGPDPAPYGRIAEVITGGAIDRTKMNLSRDYTHAQTVGLSQQQLLSRPWLWCHCGTPQKVGEGFVADDGTFSICWAEPPILSLYGCREEFAYRVTQSIDGNAVTIYDGVASGQWFDSGEDADLVSYHPSAVACDGPPDIPGTDQPIVLLHEIGHTESWHLGSPDQDGSESVLTPSWNSGLIDPALIDGSSVNRPLGGGLNLRFFFSDGMKSLARFYRVMVAPANAVGDPAGAFQPLPVPAWKTWRWTGTGWERGQHSLGPNGDGHFVIPFDDVDLLGPSEEWDPDQYHAVLDTTSFPDGKYLVKIEVFQADGTQIKPTGAGGAGTEKAFIFGRWKVQPGPAEPVPFSALTHLMWTNNQAAVASIDFLQLAGTQSSDTCQFLEGDGDDLFRIGYRAYHPNPGTPQFLARHRIRVFKGLNGGTTNLLPWTFGEVGEGVLPAPSPTVLLSKLLDGHTKCAFNVELRAEVKTTNGYSILHGLHSEVNAAFAAEATS